jgi:FtsH-binding integral membrane protein
LVSAVCSSVFLVYSKNGAEIVLAAALLTLAMTLALTAYAFTTSSDFTMIGIYHINLIK